MIIIFAVRACSTCFYNIRQKQSVSPTGLQQNERAQLLNLYVDASNNKKVIHNLAVTVKNVIKPENNIYTYVLHISTRHVPFSLFAIKYSPIGNIKIYLHTQTHTRMCIIDIFLYLQHVHK